MAIPFATSLTPQTARKAPSHRIAAKPELCSQAKVFVSGDITRRYQLHRDRSNVAGAIVMRPPPVSVLQ